jgi:hypothetical protein
MTHLIQTLKLECFFGHQRVNNILKLRLYQSVSLSAQSWKECAKQVNGDNHFCYEDLCYLFFGYTPVTVGKLPHGFENFAELAEQHAIKHGTVWIDCHPDISLATSVGDHQVLDCKVLNSLNGLL